MVKGYIILCWGLPVFTVSLSISEGRKFFSDQPAVCRICHGGESSSPFCGGEPLIAPCFCKGTMGLYHRSCLEHWLASSNTNQCEICKYPYVTMRRPKPMIEVFCCFLLYDCMKRKFIKKPYEFLSKSF